MNELERSLKSWPNFKYCNSTFLQGMWETMKR